MMYPFLTLEDETEIVHSDMHEDGSVKIYIERPDEKIGFCHATLILPSYEWQDIEGFTDDEIKSLHAIIERSANLIMEFSRNGGFKNASGF